MTETIQYKSRYDLEHIFVIPLITCFTAWVGYVAFSSFVSIPIIIIGLTTFLFDFKRVEINKGKLAVIRPWNKSEMNLRKLKKLTYYFKGESRFKRPLLLFDFENGKRIKIKESRKWIIEKLCTDFDESGFLVEMETE